MEEVLEQVLPLKITQLLLEHSLQLQLEELQHLVHLVLVELQTLQEELHMLETQVVMVAVLVRQIHITEQMEHLETLIADHKEH
jgi:hypothetical protein